VPGQTRTERIVLETARYRITGEVTLPAEGSRSRLSDMLNREGLSFIPLSDAEIVSHEDGRGERLPFIAVACENVEIAYEEQ
jgi:uncharacterized protein DUF6812